MGASLLAAIEAARRCRDGGAAGGAGRHATAPRPSPALVSLLKVLLAAKCEQHHVAARLVASSDDIERLAVEDGARRPGAARLAAQVFGEDALALRQGRIALGVDGAGGPAGRGAGLTPHTSRPKD